MSDDNPFEDYSLEQRHPPLQLSVAQQDRAAGLLVGMAIGEWMTSPKYDENDRRQHSDMITDRALIAAGKEKSEPFRYQEYIEYDPWDIRLSFGHITGAVLRELHLSADEVFQSAYFDALGHAHEMGYGHAQVMGEAYALWAVMLHQAILTGEADLRDGIPFLSDTRPLWHGTHLDWTDLIHKMEREFDQDLSWAGPDDLLHAAWAAVSAPGSTRHSHRFASGMKAPSFVKGEWGVGPFLGAALGALHGYSAIPWTWRRFLRDTRGNGAEHLMRSAVSLALGLECSSDRWPYFQRMDPQESGSAPTVVHPSDPGVLIGGIRALQETRADAAVSLCSAGVKLRPPRGSSVDHAVFWLVDSDDPQDNPNLAFVLQDAARTILALRQEGKTVVLHGLTGESRTPTVAAVYGALISGGSVWGELQRVTHALPQAAPNAGFLHHLAAADVRPTEVVEGGPVEPEPAGHLSVDRQLIELLSWTVVAELLESVAGEGWVEPGGRREDGFAVVLREGPRMEFLCMGAGITVDDELVMSWPRAVTVGTPQAIVAHLRSAARLVPELQMITSAAVPSWKPSFAASLMRNGYGRARFIRIRPLAEKPGEMLIYHYSGGPDLFCEVDESTFVVTRESIGTSTTTLWHQGEGDPDTAARAVLDQLPLGENV